jgi:hypothetical protein
MATTTTSYAGLSVIPNTSYAYQAEAYDRTGNTSAASSTLNVKTPGFDLGSPEHDEHQHQSPRRQGHHRLNLACGRQRDNSQRTTNCRSRVAVCGVRVGLFRMDSAQHLTLN